MPVHRRCRGILPAACCIVLAAILLAPSCKAQDVAAAAPDVTALTSVVTAASEDEGVTMYGYFFDHYHDHMVNLTTDIKDILVGG